MIKQCTNCPSSFEVTKEDLEFYDKVSPVFNEKKYNIPPPTLCPQCREQRRTAWRNTRFLFRRKCNKTGQEMISMYPPNTDYPVYHNTEWWKDENNAVTFGINFDPTVSVFTHLQKLQRVVPRMFAVRFSEDRLINSEYTNSSGDVKDSYLSFAIGRSEKCLYTYAIGSCYECVDCLNSMRNEGCYECINCEKCYNLQHSYNCNGCSESYFLEDCRECSNCIGCIGLRQKQYHIFNTPFTKEEYEKYKRKFIAENIFFTSKFQNKLQALFLKIPRKYMTGTGSENCSGDYVINSKNVHHSFDVDNSENCKYCRNFINGKNCMDFNDWGEGEWCLEVSGDGDNTYMTRFCAMGYGNTYCMYADMCVNCKNCFACVGLKNKQYCILNKQYTKEEYEKLVPKLIQRMIQDKEWGEFFPISLSTLDYNKSLAHDFYPRTKEEVIALGGNWYDETQETVSHQSIYTPPVHISDVQDDVLQKVLICEVTKKPYKITKMELEFYRKFSIPLPKKCPDQRFIERYHKRNPQVLYERKCDKCKKIIQTTYSPDQPEKVYCEECYLKEIY